MTYRELVKAYEDAEPWERQLVLDLLPQFLCASTQARWEPALRAVFERDLDADAVPPYVRAK